MLDRTMRRLRTLPVTSALELAIEISLGNAAYNEIDTPRAWLPCLALSSLLFPHTSLPEQYRDPAFSASGSWTI